VYRLNQSFRYDYSAPVRLLRQRLMVVPPLSHGDQRRASHQVRVDGAPVCTETRPDAFGNHVVNVEASYVDQTITFDTSVEVKRDMDPTPPILAAGALRDARYSLPSRFTNPNARLLDVASELSSRSSGPWELAEAITAWVHGALRYEHDVTTVQTSAAQAIEFGAGVCQDYAHVMLAVARACGLPSRYVSGHLVGEGGSHAWVEVLLQEAAFPGQVLAVAFDPTLERRAGSQYLTVAVGRDYFDAAPISGTFHSRGVGHVTCQKSLEVVDTAVGSELATLTRIARIRGSWLTLVSVRADRRARRPQRPPSLRA